MFQSILRVHLGTKPLYAFDAASLSSLEDQSLSIKKV